MGIRATAPEDDARVVDALRDRDERYRFLTENIPVQIWTALPDGKLDYVTDQTASAFGLTAAKLLADGWQNVVHPEDLPLAVKRWLHALETGETYEVEFRLLLRTGIYAWHLARAVAHRNGAGTIVGWLGTNTNIQEQRDTQRRTQGLLDEVAAQANQLRHQNRLLALEAEIGVALTRAAPLPEALRTCADAIVKHLDAALVRIWTVDETAAVLELQSSAGASVPRNGTHARVPVGQPKIGQIASERKPQLTNRVMGDAEIVDPEWAEREGLVAFAGYPLVLGDALVGVIGAFARHPLSEGDLSALESVANGLAQALQRHRAEEKLRVSERWLATTLTSIGDGVVTTDQEGYVTFLNPVAASMMGWTLAEATGRSLDAVFPLLSEQTRSVVESPVTKVLRQGTVVGLANQTVLVRRDGTEVPIDDSAAPIRDARGAIIGVVLVFRDAGEKRRVDAERAHLLEEAERAHQAVRATLAERERLLEIAEDARSKAEAASRTKDEFLATASHELRTPLNAILGWARILRGGNVDEAGLLRGLETIERNAKAQVQLIEDILDGSRIITGKLHLEIRSLDLVDVLQSALDAVRPAANAKSIVLEATLDRAAGRMRGDPDRLQQVVWNLVNNAIKFTPKGGKVDVCLERRGTSLELAIKDTGQGIRKEFLPHVFERFRQADASTTRRHGGLGLGLALVRHLVEAHGGTVGVHSDGEGRGATFVVTLPVQAVFPEAVEPAPAAAKGGARTSVAPALDGVSVLVIDDEPDARELVATVLRSRGADVMVAASVEQALALLDQRAPMILVSDIGMPGTDGYSLLVRVRALGPKGARIPAVALTAYAREEDRRRALEAGFQAYLAKPVEPDALIRIVAGLARPLMR